MIKRYTLPEMEKIWSDENRYNSWLKVEVLAVEAWSKLGVIPNSDAKIISKNAKFDIRRIEEIESIVRHDVIAFTRSVSESLDEEKKWIHYGLTSTDVVDTGLGYMIKQANDILRRDLKNLIEIIKLRALEHKYTICMGRTHGIHAEPTTFGLKLAVWYSEMQRNLERFERCAKNIECGKISGAVGTYANVDPFIEEYVCRKLGITNVLISTQTLQRDRHAEYIAILAIIATSIEKFATEIRSLQKSEIREVEELFLNDQKGSSAMPHKRNPIGCENMAGLARVIRGNMVTAYENVVLWHERDISHSSSERIIIPDTTILLNYMLNRFIYIIKNLSIFSENMRENMNCTYDLIYSQRVLLNLIEKGITRENAYDKVQKLAMDAWNNKISFYYLVKQDKLINSYLSDIEIKDCFDYKYHLNKVDFIFDRLGLKS